MACVQVHARHVYLYLVLAHVVDCVCKEPIKTGFRLHVPGFFSSSNEYHVTYQEVQRL